MKLEDITVALRPRQPWESGDLGAVMVRRDYGPIMRLWAITVLPIWVLLGILEPSGLSHLPFIWGLKPLYDRVVLFHLSAATFGTRPTVWNALRALPKLWTRRVAADLLWRRFSFKRSFAMPIYQLEGIKGERLRSRVTTLANFGGGSGVALTWSFAKLEIVTLLGLITLIYMCIPEGVRFSIFEIGNMGLSGWEVLERFARKIAWYVNLAYMGTVTLIEPFYVGAGFSLYLNCRTRLEGWDIELAFRSMAARLAQMAGRAAVVIAGIFLLGASVAQAQEADDREKRKQEIEQLLQRGLDESADSKPGVPAIGRGAGSEAKEIAKRVLERPEFTVHKKKVKVPEWRNQDKSGGGISAAGGATGVLTGLGEVLIWALAALAVAALAWLIYQNRHVFSRNPKPDKAEPAGARVVMGMEITAESLPKDILGAAQAAWSQGDHRRALSLLYRGALSWLVEQARAPILESDTEDDCLRHAQRLGDGSLTNYFTRLTDAWVRVAYASTTPSEGEFGQLKERWPFR